MKGRETKINFNKWHLATITRDKNHSTPNSTFYSTKPPQEQHK